MCDLTAILDVSPLRAPRPTRVQSDLVASLADGIYRRCVASTSNVPAVDENSPKHRQLGSRGRHLVGKPAEVSPPLHNL
jgi:hypothetical protein